MPNYFSTVEFTVVETHGYIQLYIMLKVCTARSLLTKHMTTDKTYHWCYNNYTEICILLKVCLLDYGYFFFLNMKKKLKAVKQKHIHVKNQYELSNII